MRSISLLSTALVVGCTGTSSQSTPEPAAPLVPPPPTSSPTASTSGGTTPTVSLPCTEVTGTSSVWLVSREDPSVLVAPAVPPDRYSGRWAAQLVGPDAFGRLYLHEMDGTLLRSDDHGCSWAPVSTTSEAFRGLVASTASERLFLSERGMLSVSDDGGLSFSVVGPDPLRWLPALSATELRGQIDSEDDEIVRSTDGGATWTTVTVPPDEHLSASFDVADLDRIVLWGDNDNIWTYDDLTWTSSDPFPALNYRIGDWNDGVLVVEAHSGADIASSVLLRSETGAPPFVQIDWQPDIDDGPMQVQVDGDQIVVTGWWDPGHVSDARGEAEGLVVVVDGTDVVRHTIPETQSVVGVGMFDDVFAVGLKLQGYFVVD